MAETLMLLAVRRSAMASGAAKRPPDDRSNRNAEEFNPRQIPRAQSRLFGQQQVIVAKFKRRLALRRAGGNEWAASVLRGA